MRKTLSPWITRPCPARGARLRLFCFPYAGGGASVYRGWAETLGPEVEVCPVQLPGREGRLPEPPFTRLSALVPVLAREVSPYLDRPFALFGHSNGALMAFELARQLRRLGEPEPAHLFVSGRGAVHLPERHPPIHHLPREAFLEGMRRYGGIPDELMVTPEALELFLPLLRADMAVHETYVHTEEEPLSCPLTAYCGEADPEVPPEDAAAWRVLTAGSFRLQLIPGGHFFLHEAREALLDDLAVELRPLAGREGTRLCTGVL